MTKGSPLDEVRLQRSSLPNVTTDETEIRQWAAKRSAHPVERAPFTPDGQPAQLGFVFGDAPIANDNLQPISWARFFAVFRLLDLVLAYDEHRDYELVKSEDEDSGRFEGKPLLA
jgi:hypothetical protein